MPESTDDAMILISISWQALMRAEQADARTTLCDCTVIIVFASFYIEANLNKIIEELGKNDAMIKFLENPRPGLRDKLAWFFNEYLSSEKAKNKKQLKNKKIDEELEKEFPGFGDICSFRNNVSHGRIDKSQANLESAKQLRTKTKEIVDKLFVIVSQTGTMIPRDITYFTSISQNYNSPNINNFNPKIIPVSHSSS